MDNGGNRDLYKDWLGINYPERPLTNYQLLGLPPFAAQTDAIERHAQQQLAKLARFAKGELRCWPSGWPSRSNRPRPVC